MADKTHAEYQYLNLLKDVMANGSDKPLFLTPEILKQYEARSETPPYIRSLFGRQIRFDLSQGFPLLTTKKVFLKGIIYELLWFLRGDSNIKYLIDNDIHIWDEWAYKIYLGASAAAGRKRPLAPAEFSARLADEPADSPFVQKYGNLGPIYGKQWRKWKATDGREIDQLAWVIDRLKNRPYRKNYIISAWNPEYIYEMALPGESMVLPPCHTIFQFQVADNRLSLQLYQRSADLFLGVPFNIASYALLTMMVAQATGYAPGDFVHTFGDVHLYSNHFNQAREQLQREPRPWPQLELNPDKKNIDDFLFEDFVLSGYDPHSSLKAPITTVGGF